MDRHVAIAIAVAIAIRAARSTANPPVLRVGPRPARATRVPACRWPHYPSTAALKRAVGLHGSPERVGSACGGTIDKGGFSDAHLALVVVVLLEEWHSLECSRLVALCALLPASAGAHAERATFFPDPEPGGVPRVPHHGRAALCRVPAGFAAGDRGEGHRPDARAQTSPGPASNTARATRSRRAVNAVGDQRHADPVLPGTYYENPSKGPGTARVPGRLRRAPRPATSRSPTRTTAAARTRRT